MIRKTAFVTATSVAGVILAGGVAVGANVSILNADDDSAVGELAAQGASTTTSTSSTTTAPKKQKRIQSYAVDSAGMVDIEISGDSIKLGDVETSAGWMWEKSESTKTLIALRFATDDDEVLFLAMLEDDGTLSAGAERPDEAFVSLPPQPSPAPVAPAAPAAPSPAGNSATVPQTPSAPTYSDDDDDQYEHEDDDDHDYDDHDDDEHHDDDDDEHEGRDEDD